MLALPNRQPAPAPPLQPTPHQTRLLNFFGTFANDAAGRDAATTEDRCNFIAVLLGPLIELTAAKDHSARWWVLWGAAARRQRGAQNARPGRPAALRLTSRVRLPRRRRFCQLVHALVGNLPPEVDASDALDKALEELEEAMLVRPRRAGRGGAAGRGAAGGTCAAPA